MAQGDPGSERDWEHWPGRRSVSSDDRIRHRLRNLFAATDDEGDIEALIVQRGREIEEQTDQLQATIADLERREEQTGKLRSAVEEMLRHGSAELDERHTQLAALAVDLGAREERVRAEERDLAVRRQELGAVELRRAAIESREEALGDREATLERIAAELTEREAAIAAAERQTAALTPVTPIDATARAVPSTFLLYVTASPYRFEEHPGPAPHVGDEITIAGQVLAVTRIGPSPLPGDDRLCGYAESTEAASGTAAGGS